MPLLCAVLVALAFVVAHGEAVPAGAMAQPSGRDSVRVMTFNIQHGIDAAGHYNLQRAIDVIAKVQPDLVGLQEVTRNHSKYRCDDQPRQIAEGLRRATGREWYHVYVQAWFVNKDRACVESGRGDGPNTEGLAFLAPEPFSSVSHQSLWNGRVGVAVRVPKAGDVPFVVTHLANGSTPKAQSDRTRQIQQLLRWVDAQRSKGSGQREGRPAVIMGDLNARPDAPELVPLLGAYRDAWGVASAAGRARGIAGGRTRTAGTSRVDYVLFTPEGVRLDWVETVDTAALIGVGASDHQPVVASFIRQGDRGDQ